MAVHPERPRVRTNPVARNLRGVVMAHGIHVDLLGWRRGHPNLEPFVATASVLLDHHLEDDLTTHQLERLVADDDATLAAHPPRAIPVHEFDGGRARSGQRRERDRLVRVVEAHALLRLFVRDDAVLDNDHVARVKCRAVPRFYVHATDGARLLDLVGEAQLSLGRTAVKLDVVELQVGVRRERRLVRQLRPEPPARLARRPRARRTTARATAEAATAVQPSWFTLAKVDEVAFVVVPPDAPQTAVAAHPVAWLQQLGAARPDEVLGVDLRQRVIVQRDRALPSRHCDVEELLLDLQLAPRHCILHHLAAGRQPVAVLAAHALKVRRIPEALLGVVILVQIDQQRRALARRSELVQVTVFWAEPAVDGGVHERPIPEHEQAHALRVTNLCAERDA
mmetsp:Transcript_2184/g.6531  ORF Transcript_2184/g.6531 Transcript_2184/m.6531 type:complete len:395 (+) Transcript_2184:566-1750(+)|eukprot:2609052-Prymnesium_polylepis.2